MKNNYKSNTKNKLPFANKTPFDKKKWGVLAVILIVLYGLNAVFFTSLVTKTIPYSEFLNLVEQGSIRSVTLANDRISGELLPEKDGVPSKFITIAPKDDNLISSLKIKNVSFNVEPSHPFFTLMLSWILPLIFLYFLWSQFSSRLGPGASGVMAMVKSKAKTNIEVNVKTTFSDVAGIDEAKEELNEIVNFLQNPKRYSRLGGRAPKGVLLVGPPGTGKTLLARAVAGEAKVPFFSINGSEFVEMFVGLGAARVRDLFEQARKEAPCILFIDEIDALGKSRALGYLGSGSSDEKEQTLNQLLAEMDGFDPSEGVIMLAATNRPEVLDPALLRAGRFDRQIMLNNPDHQGRLQILKVHVKKIKLNPSVNLAHIAAMTPGFSGADLANLSNEAAITATRRNAETVAEHDFAEAIERIVAGLERKTKLMNPLEKRRVAFHEVGHATVALALNVPDRVQKISIVPRGFNALGYTLQRPLEDRYLLDEQEIQNKISVLLGGRAAEILMFDHPSTGAGDDLSKASEIARAMVLQYGMSRALGLESFDIKRAPLLQGPNESFSHRVSEGTAREIDLEVKAILASAYAIAERVIEQNRLFVQEAAELLIGSETLNEDQIVILWKKHNLSVSDLSVSDLPGDLDA
jgi:cell division protease FtsH